MKLNFEYKKILKPACLAAGLVLSGSAFAGLINNDFSDGLTNWNADYSYFDGSQEHYYQPVTDFNDFTDNFSTATNSVTLNTSVDGVNEYFGLYLFQEFEVAANAFELSLNFDFLADHAYVTLVDENLDLLHDFINNGLTVDISHYAGSFVALEFGLEDENFTYDDYLTVSNISISEQSLSVPEPSSFAIFAFALLALSRRMFTRSTNEK
ncbi:MAG: PEP-CTERM sorting domain-containing protein [Thalassotalea sp.]